MRTANNYDKSDSNNHNKNQKFSRNIGTLAQAKNNYQSQNSAQNMPQRNIQNNPNYYPVQYKGAELIKFIFDNF